MRITKQETLLIGRQYMGLLSVEFFRLMLAQAVDTFRKLMSGGVQRIFGERIRLGIKRIVK